MDPREIDADATGIGSGTGDIYSDIRYAGCYAYTGEDARAHRFETSDGAVNYVFAIRESKLNGRYDIVTPYGYGGPTVTCANPQKRAALVRDFSEDFSTYCRREKIVSEFIRFHPLLENAGDFSEHCLVQFNRSTVGIPLGDPDYTAASLPAKCRNMVSKAKRCGVTVRMSEEVAAWREFYALYRRDMKRLGAGDFYHFPESLFDTKRTRLGHEIALYGAYREGRMIAGTLILRGGAFRHYHLAAGSDEARSTGAMNLLIHEIAASEAADGARWFHLGGGRTTAPDDTLLAFKRSFTDGPPLRFHTGKRVHDAEAYAEACALAGVTDIKGLAAAWFPEYPTR